MIRSRLQSFDSLRGIRGQGERHAEPTFRPGSSGAHRSRTSFGHPREFEQAYYDMREKHGKAGNVENLRLDELHGL